MTFTTMNKQNALHSLIFVRKQTKNCSIKSFMTSDIYFTHSSLQKEVNTTLSVIAVTTYSCLPVPQPSITITF